MKKIFYLDNFRGFSDTFIPLTDVTFLVGENSTGKTSVLNILKLISTPQFWFEQDFNNEIVHFGHFSDIVSANAANSEYFRIGIVEESSTKEGKSHASGCLFTFRERQGLPQLTHFISSKGSKEVSIRFVGGTISFKVEDRSEIQTATEVISSDLPRWIREQSSDGGGYKRLNIGLKTPRTDRQSFPIPILLSVVDDHMRTSGKDKASRSMRIGLLPFPEFQGDLIWVAPIRTKPRRTYDESYLDFSPEGLHTPYLIRKLLNSKVEAVKFREFVQSVGKASGLFRSIEIKRFGRGAGAPFEVDVVLDEKALNLNNVGYGVSQSLPVLVELLAREEGSWFAIQQPEVHLHPRAQAALGDVFFEMARKEKKRFLVETHSDFTIDRFRMNFRKTEGNKPVSQVLFFERKNKGNHITALSINSDGNLPLNQPDSYRQFFIKEEMSILGL